MTFTSARAKYAGLVAHRDPDDPAITDARDRLDEAIAERAVDDPVQLARAARIVKIALARGVLTLAGDGDA